MKKKKAPPAHELTAGQKMTAAHILQRIVDHYEQSSRAGQWIVLPEFRFSTGFSAYAERTIDVFAINCYPSTRHQRVCYEIKVSREDFKRELAEPMKRKPALYISNQFYFVTPPGLIAPALIPPEAGLMETTGTKELKVILPAPQREGYPPPWGTMAMLGRRALTEMKNARWAMKQAREAAEKFAAGGSTIDELAYALKNLNAELQFTAHVELPPPASASPATGALFDETAEPKQAETP